MVLALEGGGKVSGPVVLRKHVSQAGVQLDQGVPLRDPVQVVKGLGVLWRVKERLGNDTIHACHSMAEVTFVRCSASLRWLKVLNELGSELTVG